MDDFLTPGEKTLRRDVREYLLRRPTPAGGPGQAPDEAFLAAFRLRLNELGYLGFPPSGPDDGRAGWLESALVVEEVSASSPGLGLALIEAEAGPDGQARGADAAAVVARDIGTAAAVIESCLAVAREKGLFESALMGYQKAQTGLADALSGLEAARLLTYRALRLIDRGDGEKGRAELRRASSSVSEALAAARSLASTLAGTPGPLPGEPDKERT
ncbi:MAG: acyl-CoA dehydrogenase family protein [Acidobacteriota bacterium]